MELAQKFRRPIICFVDTPAAYPGHRVRGARRRRSDRAQPARDGDARSADHRVVHGEGGSGGALGIAIGDRILMQEFAIYSVIPPEGLRGDPVARRRTSKVEAAAALKITAPDLLALGIIDEIVPEPAGGAHNDPDAGDRARRLRRCRARSPRSRRWTSTTRLERALRQVPQDGRGGHGVQSTTGRR